MANLKLGLQLGYWGSQPPPHAAELAVEADRLGFDSVWTAEAYGSDALTPLAWWGQATRRVRLGTALCQLSARSPTAMAMAALTMDHFSGGRFVLGLGVSGPQVVEGWYGQSFAKPLARTREYVSIVRDVLAAQVAREKRRPQLSPALSGGTGLGKPLKSIVHPLRPDIPIVLGAEGPKNVALAGEIADGSFPFLLAPSHRRARVVVGQGFRSCPGTALVGRLRDHRFLPGRRPRQRRGGRRLLPARCWLFRLGGYGAAPT